MSIQRKRKREDDPENPLHQSATPFSATPPPPPSSQASKNPKFWNEVESSVSWSPLAGNPDLKSRPITTVINFRDHTMSITCVPTDPHQCSQSSMPSPAESRFPMIPSQSVTIQSGTNPYPMMRFAGFDNFRTGCEGVSRREFPQPTTASQTGSETLLLTVPLGYPLWHAQCTPPSLATLTVSQPQALLSTTNEAGMNFYPEVPFTNTFNFGKSYESSGSRATQPSTNLQNTPFTSIPTGQPSQCVGSTPPSLATPTVSPPQALLSTTSKAGINFNPEVPFENTFSFGKSYESPGSRATQPSTNLQSTPITSTPTGQPSQCVGPTPPSLATTNISQTPTLPSTASQAGKKAKPAYRFECPICLSKFFYQDSALKCVRFLACGHGFHKGCINKWFVASRTFRCPMCRTFNTKL